MKLSPIKKELKNKFRFAIADIETMNWTKFIMIGFYHEDLGFHEFKTLKKFFEYLKNNSDVPDTIFCHFGGKFDFMFLLEECIREKINVLDIIPRGSSVLCFRILFGNREFNFRDSSALLPFSLKSITDNFDTYTRKGEWDHTKTKGYSRELAEYCYADCRGLFEALDLFFNWPLIKKAGPATTIAGQAVRVLRTFLNEDLFSPGDYANNFARRAYLGGRTEIIRPYCDKGPLYEYDVNSLYPFVMRDNFFPIGKATTVFDFDEKHLGIYDCIVSAPKDMYLPALGIVFNNKYIFPVGNFLGSFTSAEIKYARSLGYKIKVRSGIIFTQKRKLFSEFITALYEIRLNSPKNSLPDIAAKLLMNSSYGRFGMNLKKEKIGFELKEGVTPYKILKVNDKNIQLYKEPTELKSFTHVAIAAFVTSYARIHMHKLMSPLGEELYYTDTDSIFTTRELKTGKGLGELKHEATYDSAVFLLPKTYFAKGFNKTKIAMKGFDSKKIRNFDLEDFKNALEGDLRKFKIINEPKFATLKQALAQNKIVSLTKKSEKQLKSVYNKRIIKKIKKGHFLTKPIQIEGI